MSFVIVNTGRAASRAFYLNVRAQRAAMTCSRHQFDDAVTSFIARGDRRPFDRLAGAVRTLATVAGSSGSSLFGLVFHGVRPRLAHPFDDRRNVALLTAMRDELGIDTAFLPVRDPDGVLLSELNRRLAEPAGDWTFPDAILQWRSTFAPHDLGALSRTPPPTPPPVPPRPQVDFAALARDVSVRTGKTFALHQLFTGVFPTVYLIRYDRFLQHPQETWDRIGALAGLPITDRSLVATKLNSLANRLLVYNPVRVAVGPEATVRFRFEIAPAIELCDDWGVYEPAGIDCSSVLPQVASDLGAPIGLGISTEDTSRLPSSERALVRNPHFLEHLVGSVAPVFGRNYDWTKAFYRRLYLDEVPPEAREVFWEHNGDEQQQMATALDVHADRVL